MRLQRKQRGVVAGAIAVGIALAVGGYLWSERDQARAVRRLPSEQRAGLYQRTMENLRTICDPAPGRSMRKFCRDQGEFALQFPECDEACRVIARRHLSLPRP